MNDAGFGACGFDAHDRYTGARRAADLLYLAAAPTFAIMAILTGVLGERDPLCSIAGASPLNGMTPMYLLMSAFHLAPWLKLLERQPNAMGQP